MARFSIPNNQRMNPPWAADTLDSSKILPGGAKIDNSPAVLALMTAFLSGATIGGQTSLKPRIQSGTVVARVLWAVGSLRSPRSSKRGADDFVRIHRRCKCP